MVADGYKETEIGVIPIEWDTKSLSELGSFSKGKGISKNEIVEDGIPCMRYAEIYTKYDIILKNIKSFINDKSAKNSKKISQGDILFAGSGETLDDIGKSVAFINDYEAYVGGDTVILSPEIEYNSLFMSYQLNSASIRTQLRKLGQGSSVVHIYSSGLEKVKVLFPPLKEQEKIADILSTADDKIDAISSQIQKAETLKKGLLQKLLNEGIGHSEFKDSELGRIPGSWEVVELGKCVEGKGNYGIGSAAVNYDENLPAYLRITDIDENGKFISTNKKCVDSPESSNYQLEDGDIVFARTGNTTGKTYLYNPDDGILIYAGFLIKFTPNKEILNTYYLKIQASTERYWNWVKVTSMRTGQPGINSEEYGIFLLPLPPLEEQKQIADILSTSDEKLEVLRAKKEKYETLKKGLLQKLLSGQVRV